MSRKNKVPQAERRAMRQAFETVITQRLALLQEYIRPKPKYCPAWLWKWGAAIFIDVDRISRESQGDI